MSCFASNLQHVSFFVHEAKIHDIIYDNVRAKLAKKWHRCFISIPWLKNWQSRGTRGLTYLMGIEMRHSSCLQCYFVPLMTFQHLRIWVDIVLRAIMHVLYICEEDTSCVQLKHERKIVYTRHRRFLRPCHSYRRLKISFNGSHEHETVLIPLTGQ